MDQDGLFLANLELAPALGYGQAPLMVFSLNPDPRQRTAPSCCPRCGNYKRDSGAIDEQRRELNALLSEAYLHAAVLRPSASAQLNAGKKIEVPWARPGTEFTQLFEALVMALIRQIPVKLASAILGAGDRRLWRFVDRETGPEQPESFFPGSPVIERRSGRQGRDLLNLFHDLDLFSGPRVREPVALRSYADEVNKEIPGLGLVPRERCKALILAAIAALVRAALTFVHFRSVAEKNDALGKVSAEEGKLQPIMSRAPPKRD